MKGFSDGSLGSSTALFFEPYSDTPNTRGLLFDQMPPEGIMLKRVEGADRAGLQVMIHAIGDEANLRILDIYKQTAELNGTRDRRFRIEHAQHLRQSEIPPLRPAKGDRVHAAVSRGGRRAAGAKSASAWNAQRHLRLPLPAQRRSGCSRSAPTGPWALLNPMTGLKAAVTRRTLDGKHPSGWMPEQKLTLDEAVRAYTLGSAYAEFADHAKGTITPGKLADVVMLDRDLYKTDPAEID